MCRTNWCLTSTRPLTLYLCFPMFSAVVLGSFGKTSVMLVEFKWNVISWKKQNTVIAPCWCAAVTLLSLFVINIIHSQHRQSLWLNLCCFLITCSSYQKLHCVCALCADCECSAAGTVDNSCRPDPRTRTCVCKPGFTGDHCDTCAPGFHGLNCQGERWLHG